MSTSVFVILCVAVLLAAALGWLVGYLAGTRPWKRAAEANAAELAQSRGELELQKQEAEASKSQLALSQQEVEFGKSQLEQQKQEAESCKSQLELQKQEAEASKSQLALARKDIESQKTLFEEKLNATQAVSEVLRANYEKMLADMRESHKEAIRSQAEAYDKQTSAIKAEMMAKTEEILKKRQEELDKKAEETFQNISGNLGKDLKDMKMAFEENKTKASEDNAAMKEKFDNAVKQLAEQSKSIGDKADHLAEAMRGQKKMQGCWGETILQNLLDAEGLVKGRDYDKEETLRDSMGMVVLNEDTDKRMRPDYILHFVDGQDVIIDSKVSLSAFADYLEAESDEARQDAAARNAAAIKEQVKKLSAKKYAEYLKPGHRMVDYVIMFVPNYPALQLAYDIDPTIWKKAYEQKVLITSSETLMPFLRMIALAWRNVEQVKNQQEIIKAAENMITRVAEFSSSMTTIGSKLEEAGKAFEAADKKLKNSGQGILVSAHQIQKLGVSSRKSLPEVE